MPSRSATVDRTPVDPSVEADLKILRCLTPWCDRDPPYIRHHRLAHGSYGAVYVAKGRESFEAVAIKYSPLLSPRTGQRSSSRVAAACREVGIARVISTVHGDACEHISHMKEAFFDEAKQSVWTVWGLGDPSLYQYLQHYRSVSEGMAQGIMTGILRGLSWMGGRAILYILHNDLKPGNVLLVLRQSGGSGMPWAAQLSDFGSACCPSVPMEDVIVTTLPYAAPEILQAMLSISSRPQGCKRTEHGGPPWYTLASDIWAAGVMLAELLSERPEQLQVRVARAATSELDEVELHMAAIRTLRAEIGRALSEASLTGIEAHGMALAQDMLHMPASMRYCADKALAHDWLCKPPAATIMLTAHRSTARDHMGEVGRAVARAYVLLTGIRGGRSTSE